jgi:hypothetical protein
VKRISPFVRGMAILVLLAIVIVAFNQEASLATASTLLRFAFYIVIAIVAYLLWRDFGRREISLWPQRQQRVFYGAVALFLVDLGWFFAVSLGGRDLLAFILVAAACVYAAVRTWREQNRYS